MTEFMFVTGGAPSLRAEITTMPRSKRVDCCLHRSTGELFVTYGDTSLTSYVRPVTHLVDYCQQHNIPLDDQRTGVEKYIETIREAS
jgi:hypothetical protein